MDALERFIKYISIPSTSDPNNEKVTPSSKEQWNVANCLIDDLKEIGLNKIRLDEHGYVYAELESNIDKFVPTIGFIAHMDTAPDFNGQNIHPQIIENYQGQDIILHSGCTLSPREFPALAKKIGKTIVTTDGTSLLGADDKAGVTAIIEAMKRLKEQPNIPHGKICVAFTPDEEIGNGAKYFDVANFGADFAYTVDGSEIEQLEDENFNAASATVVINGVSIHPGSAKNRMINAAKQATIYQTMIPDHLSPEYTEKREGFIHLLSIKANANKATLEYILRDHDEKRLQAQKDLLKQAALMINQQVGKNIVKVAIKDTYQNMKKVLDKHPEVISLATKAMANLGIEVVREPIRGGTDGATLSFKGLPCPNIGTGGANFHGPYEYLVLEELYQSIELICQIAKEGGKL